MRPSLVSRPSIWSAHIPGRAKTLLRAAERPLLWLTVFVEVVLLLVALVPQSIWASFGYPAGPIPRLLAPLVAAAFYLLPTLTGALCHRWYAAIILATLPAWLDLGLFAIAAAMHIGPFYLAQDPHTVNTVNTLELFGVLGAAGWLARRCVLESPGTREVAER
jgi:hypothetical protein